MNKNYLRNRKQILFIDQLVNFNSCHTGSLVVWVVSARMTHGAVADNAVSSKRSNKTILVPCSTGQFLMMLFMLFLPVLSGMIGVLFFAVFCFFNLGRAA